MKIESIKSQFKTVSVSAFKSMKRLSPEALWQAVGNSNEKDASLWAFVLHLELLVGMKWRS